MRNLVRQSDCKKYMGWIKRSGCTCRSTGSTNSCHIKTDQHRFALNETEAEVCVIWQTVCRMSVQLGVRDFFHHTFDQIISHLALFCCTFFHRSDSTFCCCTDSNNTRNIFCTCTTFSFLCPTMNKGTDLHAFSDIEESDSFWPVQLVSAGT